MSEHHKSQGLSAETKAFIARMHRQWTGNDVRRLRGEMKRWEFENLIGAGITTIQHWEASGDLPVSIQHRYKLRLATLATLLETTETKKETS